MPVMRQCIICERDFKEIEIKDDNAEKAFIQALETDYVCPNCKQVIDGLKKFAEKFNGPFHSGFKETKIWALAERLYKLYCMGEIKYCPYKRSVRDVVQPGNTAMWYRQVWYYVAQQMLDLAWLSWDKPHEEMCKE